MSDKADNTIHRTGFEVAIVGMAGRFPGAEDLDRFWQNLSEGIESIKELTEEEMRADGASQNALRSPNWVRRARVIENPSHFDAGFFGVSPREADLIDPQQRVFLECAWTVMEDAGYDPDRIDFPVGVYAGSRFNGYLLNVYSNQSLVQRVGDFQIQISNDKDYIATRTSYKLGLGGPSVTVQSACSTALVAVHLGCQALNAGECDLAIAGGVGIRLPEHGYPYVEGDVGSPDGHVRPFDAKANGTMFGSGLGVVVLKRFDEALEDGDNIHALIRGSAVTNDGAAKVGFSAPGLDGQYRVVRTAHAVAAVEPEAISYVEAHGTGTNLGDPIEVSALTRAFRDSTERRGFCALGSVKGNIGHLGVGAGGASLIKTVLSMKHRQLPPSINFDEPNPQIDFEASPFFVNTELRPWTSESGPLLAGVSAFGIGGTNAHVILEEAPRREPAASSRPRQLLPLSGRSQAVVETIGADLADHLEQHPDLSLADAAHTLQVGRRVHPLRKVVVAADRDEAIAALRGDAPGRVVQGMGSGRRPSVAFMFSGQGSQYVGMARDLYDNEPVFRESIDRCAEILEPHLGFDLRTLLYPDEADAAAAGERLQQTAYTQPALFAVEVSLAHLWRSWGIEPTAMVGHSIGEYVAAHLAGVFSLEDGLALVAARGRLMQELPGGDMLAVPLSEEEVGKHLDPQLSVAAVNAEGRCVVSGPADAVAGLRERLETDGLACRPLHTSHAFHSPMMEPILGPFAERFSQVELSAPSIPVVSNVTGTWLTEEEATDPGYWARHIRGTVRFAAGVGELLAEESRLLLEVGPGNTLTTLARRHSARTNDQPVIPSTRHPKDGDDDLTFVLKSLGQLWIAGAEIDWRAFHGQDARTRVSLPTYPFERQRFWIDAWQEGFSPFGADATAKKEDIADWCYLPSWKPSLAPRPAEDLRDEPRTWLVFAGDDALTPAMVSALGALGQQVVTVGRGDGFSVTDGGYRIAPGAKADYDALVKAMVADGGAPDVVLHLWNVTGDRGALTLDRVDDAEQRSFWSQVFLAQALGRQGVDQEMRWVVVSDNLHRLGGERFLSPEKAPLLGPVKVVSLEYPWIESRAVDVVMPDGSDQIGGLGELVDRLVAEATGAGNDLVVALRDGDRWVQGYEPTRLEEVAEGELMIREGGVYLITGGLGGIGLTFAEYLAREHRARLVLVGLSAMPERAGWEEWLESHSASDRTSDKIRKVMALEEAGAEVITLSADIADPEQTTAVVAQTLERFGALHGVVHAAGLAGGGMVQLKTEEVAARVLSPKIRGTVSLETALADAGVRPDFVVVCSSTIACVGGIGQVDYAAANSFLDAWAYRQQLRLGGKGGAERTLSINWGAWEEVGMAVAAGLAVGGADLAGGRETGHPLLDRCVREASDQTIYATEFSPERQWVVGEHKILGTPTLPGTSYLEIARAAFVHHASNFEQFDPEAPVELRDVFFLNPMMIQDGTSREAQITLERSGGEFKFRIATKAGDKAGGEGSWQAHVRGRVMAGEPAQAKTLDLDAIRERCNRDTITFDGSVMNEEGVGVVYWGEHWQSLKEIRLGDGEGLALLELPEEIADETRELPLHPALVDVATGIIGFVEEDNYLPLSYGVVKAQKGLTPRLYSYLKKRADGSGRETLTVDVTLVSEEGEVLVEIEHFAMKRVGEAAASFQRPAAAKPEKQADAAAGSGGDGASGESRAASPKAPVAMAASGILPREGVEVLRRMLSTRLRAPQMIASAKDLRVLIEQTRTIDREQLRMGSGGSVSRGSHERPSIPTPYVAPRNEVETRLADIWQDSLGIKEVGVHDNFFDLGGDSVMGIQLISRANEEGLELSPDQLFEHQTIAELAELLGSVGTMAAGPVPLTPYQRRLRAAGSGPSRVMVAEVEVPAEVPDRDAVAEALAVLAAAHPALGLRYGDADATPPEGDEAVRPQVVEAEDAGLEEAAAKLAADLDPAAGRSLGAAFATGEGDARLLLVVDRMVADHRSAGLLARQLSRVLEQIGTGSTPDLPGEGQPFDLWARSLAASAAERSTADEVSCWEAVVGEDALDPFADARPADAGEGLGVETVTLDGTLVSELETEVRPTFNSTLEEELLSAVGRALGRVRGRRTSDGPLTLRIERDGRRSGDADDFGDSVGSFTVAFPLTLDRPAEGEPGDTLTAVKERLRAVPGVGDGFDRLLGEAEGDGSEGLGSVAEPAVAVTLTAGPVGRPMAPERALTVVAATGDGGIDLELLYDRSRLDAATVAELGEEIGAELRALVETAKGLGDAVFSPSDFPEAGLDEDDLAKVLSKLED